jgi:hypothetical protein
VGSWRRRSGASHLYILDGPQDLALYLLWERFALGLVIGFIIGFLTAFLTGQRRRAVS